MARRNVLHVVPRAEMEGCDLNHLAWGKLRRHEVKSSSQRLRAEREWMKMNLPSWKGLKEADGRD